MCDSRDQYGLILLVLQHVTKSKIGCCEDMGLSVFMRAISIHRDIIIAINWKAAVWINGH